MEHPENPVARTALAATLFVVPVVVVSVSLLIGTELLFDPLFWAALLGFVAFVSLGTRGLAGRDWEGRPPW